MRLSEIASANRCCGELPPLSEDGAYREGEPSELCGSTDEILEGFTDWHIDGGQCVASVRCRDQSRNAANCDCMIGGADVADRMAVCGGGGSDIPLGLPVEGVDDPVAATYDPATGGCWLLYTCEDGGRWVLSASQCPYVGESYTQPTQFYDHRQDVPECGGGGATDPLVDDDPSGDGAEGPEWVGMAITGAVTRPWWGVPAVDWGALAAGGLRLAGLAALGLLEGHGPRRRTCSRDFPAYTPCWAIDDWRYGSAEDKARSFGPGCKAVKPESTFNAYCAGEVTHWNIRCGGVFVNSVLCCQCCDDERTPGSAYLRTACR